MEQVCKATGTRYNRNRQTTAASGSGPSRFQNKSLIFYNFYVAVELCINKLESRV